MAWSRDWNLFSSLSFQVCGLAHWNSCVRCSNARGWKATDAAGRQVSTLGRSLRLACSTPVLPGKNDHKLGGSKEQKFVFSQLWSREVQNQDIGSWFPLETLRDNMLQASSSSWVAGNLWHSLACSCITPLPVSTFTGCSVCVCFLFLTKAPIIGWGPTVIKYGLS